MRFGPAPAWGAALCVFMAATASADGVAVRAAGLFPSDRYTVRDWTNNTFRRIALPKPDCAVRPSDCADIDMLNALDGFSTQPRISVPFTGDIDVPSVSSETVFLFNLGDTLSLRGFGQKVGINQIVWNPASKTLSFESDQLLAEHSRYLLVVTDGVRDAAGKRIRAGGDDDDDRSEHARDVRDARRALPSARNKIAAATLFTTQASAPTC